MSQVVHRLGQSYLLVALAALVFGLTVPGVAGLLSPYSTFFLSVVFFLTALKVDFKEVASYLRDWRMVLETNALMLVVFPAVVYYVMLVAKPELALPFLILAAMPTAMAAPLIAELLGGRQSLALVATVTTSLLAPLTVPFVLSLLAGAQVVVPFGSMFISLAKVIFLPFALAEVVKYIWPRLSTKVSLVSSPLSVVLLGAIIAAVSARQAPAIIGSLSGGQTLRWLGWLMLLFAAFHVLGYWAIFWRPVRDRFTISLCLTYMNFLLAIYLADTFFPQAAVTVPVILSVVPWTIFLPLSGLAARKLIKI
ncbi:MAG: bile acid:sodium symporter [Candidatus Veblenbacteria bacterium]|nr:bile acid:sodium symporter [Candidatus Veblenbacteria bacterium]